MDDTEIRFKTLLSYLHHPSTPEWYKKQLEIEFIKTYVIDQLDKWNIEDSLKGGVK